MKNVQAKSRAAILHRIETIEKEVSNLKLSILKNISPSQHKVISLKGILKGIEITETDIETAKKALYSDQDL
ncbi:MAG: hypothetical protein V2B19_23605 [Pseudomonadota bacterium]